jgi:2,5-diketo-D-gluconate reductase B
MEIPPIGFGTYRLHKKTRDSVINAIKVGYRHIDTAPLYKNEAEVGTALSECGVDRKHIFVTTKISRKELETNKLVESIGDSLRKLNTDYIDLLLLHEPIDFEKNWQILCDYYETKGRGIVRNIGVSNFNKSQINAISGRHFPYCNQIELNPFLHRVDLVEICRQKNIKIVAHTPLAKGEKMDNEILSGVAKKYDISPAQAMLKWNYEQGNIVIPRSSNPEHIKDNFVFLNRHKPKIFNELNGIDLQYATHPKYLN